MTNQHNCFSERHHFLHTSDRVFLTRLDATGIWTNTISDSGELSGQRTRLWELEATYCLGAVVFDLEIRESALGFQDYPPPRTHNYLENNRVSVWVLDRQRPRDLDGERSCASTASASISLPAQVYLAHL